MSEQIQNVVSRARGCLRRWRLDLCKTVESRGWLPIRAVGITPERQGGALQSSWLRWTIQINSTQVHFTLFGGMHRCRGQLKQVTSSLIFQENHLQWKISKTIYCTYIAISTVVQVKFKTVPLLSFFFFSFCYINFALLYT